MIPLLDGQSLLSGLGGMISSSFEDLDLRLDEIL